MLVGIQMLGAAAGAPGSGAALWLLITVSFRQQNKLIHSPIAKILRSLMSSIN